MSEPETQPPPGRARTLVCVAWLAVVSAAWLVTYASSLFQFARGAAARVPYLSKLLHLLGS